MESPVISGIAFNRDESRFTISGVPDKPATAAQILQPISTANIDVDMIVQNTAGDKRTDFTFTVHRDNYNETLSVLEQVKEDIGAKEVIATEHITKVSIVGVGMQNHPGVAQLMFKTLGQEGINIHQIATSEIKISVLVDAKYMELAVRSLHQVFELQNDPVQEKTK
jgi:aspartate kinase